MKALKETRAATEAARNSLDLTKTYGEAQTRAYISFWDGHFSDIEDGKPIEVTIGFRNTGNSPCFITAASIGINVAQGPLESIDQMPALAPVDVLGTNEHGPGVEWSRSIKTKRALTADEAAKVISGEYFVAVSCLTRYRDIFGATHSLRVDAYRRPNGSARQPQLTTLALPGATGED
ncbi:hypothetical protein JI664_14800 [Rhodobacter sp. NTK016B]|uniref:hypothetical protein n=1 Tax=Rhodobacter sp. NTK016B TaxID=2759676 RepID=UPI001A8DC0EE|nr:hypothetical protein [Rhodobacter sp. NTK016B]MBN8293241.1 hypothetical protein [Rhodobacter sp. NTK016B]